MKNVGHGLNEIRTPRWTGPVAGDNVGRKNDRCSFTVGSSRDEIAITGNFKETKLDQDRPRVRARF